MIYHIRIIYIYIRFITTTLSAITIYYDRCSFLYCLSGFNTQTSTNVVSKITYIEGESQSSKVFYYIFI